MPEQVRKVIISDGDQELLFLLRNAFVSVGFQVVTVSKNGKKLWETIRNERPDAVICNVFMPHYDVISIMEKLRGEKDINFPVYSIWDKFTVKEINEKLVLYLGKLSEKDRRLFIDATIKGYRYKELTERYQMTEGNISVKIFRLRMRLRKMFDLED